MSFASSTRGFQSSAECGSDPYRLRRIIRSTLLSGGSTVTFALLANLNAGAANAAAPADVAETSGLTEIVVTAEKRSENLEMRAVFDHRFHLQVT